MSEVFHFPFAQPWMSEAADPVNSEPPALRRVQNGRFRRLGRLSKRTGFQSTNVAVSPNSTALSGRPMLLGDFNGRNILVSGDGILYTRSGDFYSWTESDRIPTFTPYEAKEIARNDVSGPLDFPTVAASSGFILVGYNSSAGGTFALDLFDTGGVKLWSSGPLTGADVKVVSVGQFSSSFVVVTRSSTTLSARTFDASTLTLSGTTTVGTLNASTDNWDINTYSSTQFLLAYRDAATQARVELWSSSTLTLAASAAFTINNQRIMPAVFGVSPENIYVAWWDPQATRSVKARAYDSSLVLTSGGTVTLGDSVGSVQKPVIGRRNSTSAHVLWSGNSSATDLVVSHCTFTAAGVAGAISEIPNAHIASEPFDSDEDKLRLWVQQPTLSTPVTLSGGATFSSQMLARYVLITLRSMGSFFEALPELHTDAGFVPFASTFEDHQTFQVAQTSVDYVCAVKRRIRGIPNASSVNNTGVSLLRFRGSERTPREAQRQGIEAQRVYHVTGGELIEHMGSASIEVTGPDTVTTGIENNFLQAPILFSGTATAGGSLTSGAVYQFCAVFECLDSAGRRTRSAPSNIVAVNPSAGNLTATLSVGTCGISGRRQKAGAQPVATHVYRTLANGSIFYRTTSDVTAPDAFAVGSSSNSQLFTDGQADTDIDEKETLYAAFQSANDPCPSHRFGLQGGGRMFVAGLWDPTEVRCSKPFVLDEPVQFSEGDSFRILVPAPVTGLGWLDGALVIFCERSIYVVSGDGPDRQGAGAFGVPQRLPGDVGCIDWRTVREVPQGLLFQSARGFYLIPRGFGAPIFQADVQESVDSNAYPLCFGAGRHEVRESTLVYLMGRGEEPAEGESIGLAYDLPTGKWVSVDTYAQPFTLIGSWGSQMAAATDDLATLALAFGEGDPDATYVELHAKTGQFHPFGFGGYGSVQEIRIYGEYRALAYIGIRVVIDGITSTAVEKLPSADTRNNAVNGVFLSQGEKWFYRWQCPKIEGNSFEVEVWDALDDALGSIGEGTAFHGISMLVDRQSGSKPLGPGNRG